MTEQEFKRYIEHGYGRAVLLLRKEEDPARFREILFQHLTEDSVYPRRSGIYEKELIDCLPDPAGFAAALAETLFPRFEEAENIHMVSVLVLYGYEEPIRRIAEHLYERSLAELREFCRQSGETEVYPTCISQYCGAVWMLGKYLPADRARLKRMLLDIADLLEEPHPVTVPILPLVENIGRDRLYSLLDEVAAEHPRGMDIHLNRILTNPEQIRREPFPDFTADTVFGYPDTGVEFKRDHTRLHASMRQADETVVREIAARCLTETDPERRVRGLHMFIGYDTVFDPPVFPLDPAPLIEMAERERVKLRAERTEDLHVLHNVLSRVRHPAVLAYAQKLLLLYPPEILGTNLSSQPDLMEKRQICRDALRMRWRANYTAADREEFAAILGDVDNPARDLCMNIFARGLTFERPDLPTERIPFVLETSDWTVRYEILEWMKKNGMLTGELREECRYDARIDIRKLAEEEID